MAQGFDDEEFPFALGELANRKHSKTEEICLILIFRHMKDEKEIKSLGDTSMAISTLYSINKNKAISFFKENYKSLPIDAFATFIEDYTGAFYKEEEIDKDLISLIKKHLKKLNKKEINEIQYEYDLFMKTYK